MLFNNKIDTVQLGVIAAFISLVGSFLVFVVALTLLNEQSAKHNSSKDAMWQQIQNLQGQLQLLK